jgi:hypothetical protein
LGALQIGTHDIVFDGMQNEIVWDKFSEQITRSMPLRRSPTELRPVEELLILDRRMRICNRVQRSMIAIRGHAMPRDSGAILWGAKSGNLRDHRKRIR